MPKFVQGDLFEDFAPPPKPTPTPEPKPAPAEAPVVGQAPLPRATRSQTTFLGWDRPLLDSAAEYLIGDRAAQRLIDLSDQLVVVPTQHAGRRLREALATRSASFDGAVVPPIVVPPDFLISPTHGRSAEAAPLAGNAQVLLLWADILRGLDLGQFRHLFPVDPVERSFSWAIQTAGDILTMRKALGEAGLSITAAAEILAEQGMEPGRWRQLADLELRADRRLERVGLTDTESARREAAQTGQLPPGIKKVTLLATPDPPPLVIDALRKIATHTPIEVAIHAPKSRANHFDQWGRPITELWTAEQVDIPEPLNTIHLSSNPASQAELATDLLGSHENPAGLVAIGVPDEEIIAPLQRELATDDLNTFNPAGTPFLHHEVYYLMRVLGDLVASRSYDAFAQLIRIPDFIRAVAVQYERDSGAGFDHLAVLKNFDSLHNDHLPDTLENVQDANSKRPERDIVPEQAYLLTLVSRWLKRLASEPLGRSLPEFLTMVYADRSFDPANAADRAYTEISAGILTYLGELDTPLSRGLDQPPAPADLLSLLLQLLANQPFYADREDRAGRATIDLQGWLELLWEDAPHLIITGFNEGNVPDAIIGDAYLPNQARKALGLRDNDHRLARDSYYLTALLKSRAGEGRVDLLVGKTAADNTPLSPSRLLFLCPDEELPTRAKQLFDGELDEKKPALAPWSRAWQLATPPLPADARIRQRLTVTQFTDYLRCPFRFFLKHGLGMEEYDRHKLEMDARDFGNLCHDALEKFGGDESVRDSTSEKEISNYLIDQLEKKVHHRYGSSLTVPILIQLETAKQRLSWAARIQARERSHGWVITDVEWSVPYDEETRLPKWQLGGRPIAFKIDRIERHEVSGEMRVLDYKTSDRATPAADTHLERIPWGQSPADFPDWALTTGSDGKPKRWVNLQLPLYLLALRDHYEGASTATISAGLFKLPKAASETKIDLWHGLNSQILESARDCATAVIENIKNQAFWPPNKNPRYDDFKKLFFEDAEASVTAPSEY